MSATGEKRSDLGLALFLLILAALPRLWSLDSLGLNHFDEGGYATSALAVYEGTAPEAFHPLQHFLSPPLYFGLAGILMKLCGVASDMALIGISIFFGILTAPLVFLAGREWTSRGAAAAAGVLVALSDFHILYSRMALTDVTFCFFFVLALWLYSASQRRKSMALAVAAGVAVGLAWNTKYHGWLAGFVAACAFVPVILRDRSQLRGTLARFAVSVAVACSMYLPWFLYVNAQEGGYARLTAEQGSFLADWTDSLKHVLLHADGQILLDGFLSRLSLPLAALVAALVDRARPHAWMLTLFVLAWLIGSLATLAVVSVIAFFCRLRPAGMLVAFFAVFSVLTPLYHPYTRLLLPWACTLYLVGAAAPLVIQSELWERKPLPGKREEDARARIGSKHATFRRRSAFVTICGWIIVMFVLFRPYEEGRRGSFGDTFAPTNGFARAAEEISGRLAGSAPVAVLGEPAVVFYLRARGHDAVHVNSRDELGEHFATGDRVTLIGGHYARRLGAIEATSLERFEVEINDARLLDDAHPWQARQWRSEPAGRHDLELFEIVCP